MVDLTRGFVSKPFAIEKEFNKVGNYLELKDNNNRLGIHRRIQLWDRNGILACINYNKGLYYYKLGQLQEALSCCDKGIELNPKFAYLYFARGVTYYKMDQYAEAISDYSKSIDINPEFTEAFNMRAYAYFREKQYDKAISDLNKVIDLNPKYTQAYCERAAAYYKLH